MVERGVHVLGIKYRGLFLSSRRSTVDGQKHVKCFTFTIRIHSVISKMKFQCIGFETWFQFLKVVISNIFVKFHSNLRLMVLSVFFSFTLHIFYLWFDARKYLT